MKFISLILSAYLLLLFGVPCCEEDSYAVTEQSTSHNDQRNRDCDNCSPFFNCSGCTGSVFAVETLDFPVMITDISRAYTGYITPFAPEVNYDFWQPPQLS